MAHFDELSALSPLDGRYFIQTQSLRKYFSEFALIKYRTNVELQYLSFLSRKKIIRTIKPKEKILIKNIVDKFSIEDAVQVKVFEQETKHDVKSLEYFLKEKLESTTLRDILPFVHFGLTSEDVNAIAYALMIRDAHKAVVTVILSDLLSVIRILARTNTGSFMLAKTHGQAAVPTTFGKEISVFYVRLKKVEKKMRTFQFEGKLNGAVGNYNALELLYPRIDWTTFSEKFITSLGLTPNLITTQILPGDTWVEYTSMLSHINGILIGLCQDLWTYTGNGLLKQKPDNNQVGSSTMPNKINPIDFENAEGNLMVANSYFELYARKLLVSRLQRDLSDSTVKRTIGTSLGHTVLAWKSLVKGLGKIYFSKEAALSELNEHWEILAEAIQLYLKVNGDAKGYEVVKNATMGKQFGAKEFHRFVKKFPSLANLSPATYIGLAEKLTRLALKKS